MRTATSPWHNPWVVAVLLWATLCINYIGRILLTVMREPVLTSIPMSEAQFGLLTSVFLWVYGTCNPIGGFLADRISRRAVIIGCTLVGSVATWMTAYATSFPQMVAIRALVGLSQACEVPAVMAMVADYHRGSTRSVASGFVLTGSLCGALIGGGGGWVAESYSWSFAFVLTALAGIAFAAALFFTLREHPGEPEAAASVRERPALGTALASLLGNYSMILFLLTCAICGAINWLTVGWTPTFLRERFHLSLAEAGFVSTVYVNPSLCFFLIFGGWWTDRWHATFPRARVWVPIIGLLAACPGFVLAGLGHHLVFAILGLLLWGLANGLYSCNLLPILCLISDSRYRATGYGLINGSICVTGGLLIYGAGMLRDNRVDLGLVFAWCALPLAICMVILYAIRTPARLPR